MWMLGSSSPPHPAHMFVLLRQDFGPIGLIAAVQVEVEALLDGGLDEIHVGTDKVRHRCECI